MSGRTPREAVVNFVGPLQKALDCVTDAVLLVSGGYHIAEKPHALTLRDPAPLTGRDRLRLSVAQRYRVVEDPDPQRGPYKVKTVAYHYAVSDEYGEELFAYQYDADAPGVTLPHLHIGAGFGVTRSDFSRIHFPTGRIALERVLRLLIMEFEVTPRREDWSEVLERTQRGFEEYRTWN